MKARRVLIATVTALSLIGTGCDRDARDQPGLQSSAAPTSPKSDKRETVFVDVAPQSGLAFDHFIGASGKYYMTEIIGAGGALFDYDDDGDLDVYLVQGAMLEPGLSPEQSTFPPALGAPPGDRLFRNELAPGGELRFTDVTDEAGLGQLGYGMGVAVGDYDGDGDPDLYVTNFGPNVLYRNDGDGRFSDVTHRSGTDDPRWSTSAAFVDYDRDGDLDIFVTNYVAFSVAQSAECRSPGGKRDYCGPESVPKVPDSLFRNDGEGVFTDVTAEVGMHDAVGPGLGVVCADFDGDGWPDIFVANDGEANHLWMNRGGERFENTGLVSGTAYNSDGAPEASMGITAGDYDGDGDEDLFMTHLVNETNTLYANDGGGMFRDATDEAGLGHQSLVYTGFGSAWFDYDNDGWLDVFVANGNVRLEESRIGVSDYPFEQPNLLFRNVAGRFENVSRGSGEVLELLEVSRGAAFGDVDNDGDIDILLTNNNGPARLMRNEVGSRNGWVRVRLRGVGANRHGVGGRVALLRDGRPPLWRRAHTDGSYLCASDPRVHFGLGQQTDITGIAVIWPDGQGEVWHDIPANRDHTLTQGSGEPWTPVTGQIGQRRGDGG